MKAVILAAGMGTRLKPLTNDIPKTMVKVNDEPILSKQIKNLIDIGVKNIIVVTGYKSKIIVDFINKYYPFVKIIENKDFKRTNNMYSLYLTKGIVCNNGFLLMNGDVFFDVEILRELISDSYGDSIVVEVGAYNEENMKVRCVSNRIIEISKNIPKDKAYGVSIDIYKITASTSKKFFDIITEYIEIKNDLTQWTEVALNDLLKVSNFQICPLKGRWIEIDNLEDLKKAEAIFK